MRRTDTGFTLIEVLVAVMILAFAVVAAFGAQSSAIGTSGFVEDTTVAMMLARCRMSEVEMTVREEGGFQEMDVEEEGPCCEIAERDDFVCRTKIEKVELPEMSAGMDGDMEEMVSKGVELAFGEKAAGRMSSMGGFDSFANLFLPMLNNIFGAGIRRVTVVVAWRRNWRDREFGITEYMVHPTLGGLSLIKAAEQAEAAEDQDLGEAMP